MIYIGIDTGVNTGFAVWDSSQGKLLEVDTLTITQAMDRVKLYCNMYRLIEVGGGDAGSDTALFVEDARLRTWFGSSGKEKLQGAGSIKRDARIWQDWCRENGIRCKMIAPKNNRTKLDQTQFKMITKWTGRTSQHGRDAAMLIFNQELY